MEESGSFIVKDMVTNSYRKIIITASTVKTLISKAINKLGLEDSEYSVINLC